MKKNTERRYGFENKGKLTKREIVGDYINLGMSILSFIVLMFLRNMVSRSSLSNQESWGSF